MERIVKDLFHLFKKEDNPDKISEESLALKAFKEMDTDTDGKITGKISVMDMVPFDPHKDIKLLIFENF